MRMLYILRIYMVFTFKFKPRMVLVSYHDKILMMFSRGWKWLEILNSDILFTDWTSMLPVSCYINAYNLIYLFTFPVRMSSIFIPRKIIAPKQSTYYDSIIILSILYIIRKSITKNELLSEQLQSVDVCYFSLSYMMHLLNLRLLIDILLHFGNVSSVNEHFNP